jgi:hypothetical protein
MEKDIAKIFDESAKVSLSASEKEQTRIFLASYVEAMPAVHAEAYPPSLKLRGVTRFAFISGLSRFFSRRRVREAAVPRQEYRGYPALLFAKRFMPVFSILLAASLAVGGISSAAEGALPGDALYPVKVGVNEEVRSYLTVSPQAKAAWESRRVERRLEEAESLASKDRLDAAARADIETRVAIHTARINENVDDLEDSDDFENAAEASSHLEGALAAHRKILSRISDGPEVGKKSEIAALAAAVDSETAQAGESRSKNEGAVADRGEDRARTAAEAKMSAVGKFNSATHAILSVGSRLGADATVDARARLDAADAAYADGQAKLKAGLNSEAFVLFQEAHRASNEARLLLRSEDRVSSKADRRQKKEDKKKQEEDRRNKDEDKKDADVNSEANVNVDAEADVETPDERSDGKIELRIGR